MVSRTNRNYRAGELIRRLRSDMGLSPEALSYAIYEKRLGSVSARTIRRIEAEGMVPRIRAQFAIAKFFGRDVTSIWEPPPIRKARGLKVLA